MPPSWENVPVLAVAVVPQRDAVGPTTSVPVVDPPHAPASSATATEQASKPERTTGKSRVDRTAEILDRLLVMHGPSQCRRVQRRGCAPQPWRSPHRPILAQSRTENDHTVTGVMMWTRTAHGGRRVSMRFDQLVRDVRYPLRQVHRHRALSRSPSPLLRPASASPRRCSAQWTPC